MDGAAGASSALTARTTPTLLLASPTSIHLQRKHMGFRARRWGITVSSEA